MRHRRAGLSFGECCDKVFHPVQTLFQLCIGVAVAEADIAFRSEAAAGDGGNFPFFDHPGAEGAAVQAEFFDVGEHVEGTLRLREGQPHLPQAAADIVPAFGIDFLHGGGVLRQCGDGGLLDEGGHGGDIRSGQQQQPFHHIVRAGQIAHPPASHGIGLGKALAEDQLLLQLRVGAEIGAVFPIGQPVVHIVADQENGPAQHGGFHIGKAFFIEHNTGGIAGGIDENGLGPGGDGCFQGFFGDLKPGFGHIQRDDPGTGDGGKAFVQAETGGGHDDLLSGIQNAEKGSEQSLTGTDGDKHLIGSDGIAAGGLEVCHGFAQGGDALVGGIVGLACVEGGDGGSPDGLRGVKVRLTDGQHGAVGSFPCHVGIKADGTAFQAQKILI